MTAATTIACLAVIGLPGLGAAVAAETPQISVQPDEASPGASVEVIGSGFGDDCDVLLHWGSADGELLGIASLETDGTFAHPVAVPTFVQEGDGRIEARGRASGIEGCGELSGAVAGAPVTVTGPVDVMFDRRIHLVTRTLDDPGIDDGTIEQATSSSAPIHAIVQLESLPRPGDLDALEAIGITLLQYLNAHEGPGTAYLAAIAPSLAHEDPRFAELVRGLQPLLPEDRIEPGLATGPDSNDVLIATFGDVHPSAARGAFARNGVAAERAGPKVYQASQVAQEKIAALAEEDVVQFITPVPEEGQLDLDNSRTLHNVDAVHQFEVPSATYLGVSGIGVQVSIHDSGVDGDHEDFAGRMLNSLAPSDEHGTHVASIAAGSGAMSDQDNDNGVNNGGTAWQWRGTAPQSGVAAFGTQTAHSTAIMDQAINDLGADVSNHSYSYNDGQYDGTMVSIDEIIRGDAAGIPPRPMVFSAGNQGTAPQFGENSGYFSLSKSCKNCIIVANLQDGGALNGGSSHGPTPDGRLKPDLGANGSGVTAAVGSSTTAGQPNIGNNYVSKGGTSMAAPAVTGVVALLLQQYASQFGVDLDANPPLPSTVKAILLQAAQDLQGTASGTNPDTGVATNYGPGPDWGTGYGLVDVQAGVDLIEAELFLEDSVSETDHTDEHLVGVVPGQDELRVTVAWDDLPGTPNADHATPMLVNDLDLLLIGPNGEVHRPLVLPPAVQFDCDAGTDGIQTGTCGGTGPGQDPGPWPTGANTLAAAEGTDRLNNVEQVVIDDPAPGLWRARVSVLNTDTTIRLPLGDTQSYSVAGVTDARADLSITKTDAPDPATAGEQILYGVEVTNDGPDDAVNVTVVDELPDGVTYVTDTDSCTEGPAGTLTCSLGDLASGASTSFEIRVDIDPSLVANAGGPITLFNTATVYSNTPDDDPGDNTVTEGTIIEDLADLQLTKQCKPDDEVDAGDPITCTILVDNLGPSDARDVVVVDENLSDGDFSIDSTSTDQGFCTDSGGTVTCTLGIVAAGDRVTIEVVLSADDGMDINNVATVTSDTPDPNTANNQDEERTRVVARADLSVTKTATPDPVVAGESLTYEIEVSNAGPSEAADVLASDAVPSGVTIDSVSASHGGSCTTGVPGDVLSPTTCTFGTVPSGGTRAMTIEVTVDPGTTGTLKNNVWVRSDTNDPDTSDNQASTSTTVDTVADLALTKTAAASPVQSGKTRVEYRLVVTNDGPSDAQGVEVLDELPSETTGGGKEKVVLVFLSPSDECHYTPTTLDAAHTVLCDLGTVPAGASRTIDIHVEFKGSGELENVASVDGETFDPDDTNNSDSVVTVIGGGGGGGGGGNGGGNGGGPKFV